MQVRAIKEGYHNHRLRKLGEVFELETIKGLAGPDNARIPKTFTPDMQFSDFWMEKVDEEDDKPKAKVAVKKAKPSEDVI